MDKFTPKNNVQKFASQNRGIDNQAEFLRSIKLKPWKVSRLTARNWWLIGVTDGTRLGGAKTLASFLKVKIDDLVEEE